MFIADFVLICTAAPYTGIRTPGRRHPGTGGQDALGGERDRRLPVARRHRILHRALLPDAGEAEPAVGHAETRHPGGIGARIGQHPDEDPRRRHARLSRGSERQYIAKPFKVNRNSRGLAKYASRADLKATSVIGNFPIPMELQ